LSQIEIIVAIEEKRGPGTAEKVVGIGEGAADRGHLLSSILKNACWIFLF
jgi:hypothetical protein